MAPHRTPEERFWSKVEFTDSCWTWQGRKLPNGYGHFWCSWKRKKVLAHRWAYEYFNGPYPLGTQTDHLCRNRACVRLDHLEAVTPWENSRRAGIVGNTHCREGHEFTEANIMWEFVNKRWWTRKCRICWRAKEQRRNVRRRGVPRKVRSA